MKLFLTFALLCGLCLSVNAQNVNWARSKNILASNSSITLGLKHSNLREATYACGTFWEVTLSGGFASPTGPILGFVTKYDSSGNVIWSRNATSNATASGSAFVPTAIAVDNADNIYVAGYYSYNNNTTTFSIGGVTFSSTPGAYILKFDSGGVLIRTTIISTSYVKFIDIDVDANANVYVLGSARGLWSYASTSLPAPVSGLYNTRDFVISCDSSFTPLWAKPLGNYDMNFASGLGSTSDDSGMQKITVDKTGSGAIYICGMFNLNYSFQAHSFNISGTTKEDALIFKLNRSGIFQSGFSYGGSNADILYGIGVNRSGSLAIAGYFTTSTTMNSTYYATTPGFSLTYVACLDTNLNFQWLHTTGIMSASFTSVAIDDYKRVAFATQPAGYSNSPYLKLYDSIGNVLFSKSCTFTATALAAFDVNALCFSKSNSEVLYLSGRYRPDVTFAAGVSISTHTTYTSDIPLVKYTIPFQNSSLPVLIKSFTLKTEPTDILLMWETASEINNEGFWIERSFNGLQFDEIGFIKGNGNSNLTNNYRFNDNGILKHSKNLYYRLNQKDFDGHQNYSPVLEWHQKMNEVAMFVSPNPATASIHISGISTNKNLQLFDMSGREIDVVFVYHENDVILQIHGLIPGLYFLRNKEEVVRIQIN